MNCELGEGSVVTLVWLQLWRVCGYNCGYNLFLAGLSTSVLVLLRFFKNFSVCLSFHIISIRAICHIRRPCFQIIFSRINKSIETPNPMI